MYTSGIEPRIRRRILACLICSALLVLLSDIYQVFGHGVTSRVMSLTPAVPLLGGMLQIMIWEWVKRPREPLDDVIWKQNILLAGLSAITAGMFLQGIVDIAGVDSIYPIGFVAVGGVMALIGSIAMWCHHGTRANEMMEEEER